MFPSFPVPESTPGLMWTNSFESYLMDPDRRPARRSICGHEFRDIEAGITGDHVVSA